MADRGKYDLGPTELHVSSATSNVVIASRLDSDANYRLSMNADGQLAWGGGSSTQDWTFLRNASTSCGFKASTTEVLRFKSTATSGEINLLIYANVLGTSQLTQISYGSIASGGTGYRLLRIPDSAAN